MTPLGALSRSTQGQPIGRRRPKMSPEGRSFPFGRLPSFALFVPLTRRCGLSTLSPVATVLIVDDEPDIRSLIAMQLSIAGHRVIEASEGRGAIDAINAGGIDIVLLDLIMPKMDGWAVLWTLHDLPSRPPVIVMSGRSEYDYDHPPLGAARYLHKPFAMEEAVSSVTELLATQG